MGPDGCEYMGGRSCAAEILATIGVHPDQKAADAPSRVFVEDDAEVWEKAVEGLSKRFDVRVFEEEAVRRHLGHKEALVREGAGRATQNIGLLAQEGHRVK